MKNIAVILAGGQGARFGDGLPKQMAKVAGKTVLEHTISIFQDHPRIGEIAIVTHSSLLSSLEKMLIKNSWHKVKKMLQGGDERYLSSLAAIKAYENEPDGNLIFHDAVRPMLSQAILDRVISALEFYDAVDVAIPSSDTILKVSPERDIIADIPSRGYMYQGQTPQAFKWRTIHAAYEKALQDPDFKTTDDCGVVAKYLPDTPIRVVEGAVRNIKLTYQEDLHLLDKLFQLNSIELVEKNFNADLSGRVGVVFGGNSGIGQALCELAQERHAKVYSFSRTTTGTDICDLESVSRALMDVTKRERRIDFVVNTAAVLKKEAFHLMDPADIYKLVDINYKGAINVAFASFPHLKRTKGQLLLFTSSSYTLGRPLYSIYSSAKAAIVNFTQALAQEWSEFSIQVNCINPERTNTAMRVANFGFEDQKTLLNPRDVALAGVAALSSGYTGQVIDVKLNTLSE